MTFLHRIVGNYQNKQLGKSEACAQFFLRDIQHNAYNTLNTNF